ncbi:Protein of unknown function [Actinacidiphila rubida]|uniref:DUF3263 domain-containing protein n=1 Tax=Actinacidiphila rubida TaxID=310780 RepID=A0A1H8DF84_9ACTN|nr:DUF3263 domain-containing protein [Actinacidiphila rubida]SEN05920.1 Protein of unknown function [Actinacidiphila rubida]
MSDERPRSGSDENPLSGAAASAAGAGGEPGGAEPGSGSGRELSERDRAVLDIAGRTWTGPGPRERAIRERLDLSPTAYFQLLNALIDDPRALRHAPVTVNRLRAERDRQRAAR